MLSYITFFNIFSKDVHVDFGYWSTISYLFADITLVVALVPLLPFGPSALEHEP